VLGRILALITRRPVEAPQAPAVEQAPQVTEGGGHAAPAAVPGLTPRDMDRLRGVHPDLVLVVKLARSRAPFFVAEGLRSQERQKQLVAEGKSKTMNSRHLTGHAVDLYPISDTPIPKMTRADFLALAEAMRWAAAVEGVPLVWGGDWRSFVDAPHWELPRGSYPG
jgi:peptidoglycan L-alanyl-D-glutamate endopeptidase CwlK